MSKIILTFLHNSQLIISISTQKKLQRDLLLKINYLLYCHIRYYYDIQ